MQEAEIKAQKLLDNAEFEANMSSQQKITALMNQEESQSINKGETMGFIKKFTNRQTLQG